jgi:hypothetical protein
LVVDAGALVYHVRYSVVQVQFKFVRRQATGDKWVLVSVGWMLFDIDGCAQDM